MTKPKEIQEIPFNGFAMTHRLASIGKIHSDTFSPAITHNKNKEGYSIRIKTGQRLCGNYMNTYWEYFETDETGLIVRAPRGLALKYKNKVRLLGMDQAVHEYKTKFLP